MRSIALGTSTSLTLEERGPLQALSSSRKNEARMRDRARIVLLAADGLALRGRTGGWLDNGGGVEVAGALCQRPVGASERDRRARRRTATEQITTGVFWRCSISQRARAIRTGRRGCWRASWATSVSASGGSCGRRRSTCRGASLGARAMIWISAPKRQRSPVST
jgi:hypothetical protein